MASSVQLLPGNGRFTSSLWAMRARATNATPAFEIIDQSFLDFEKKMFDDEGPGWVDLADSTVLRKSTIDGAGGILVRGEPGHTEGLMNSLTTRGSGSLSEVTPLSVTVGTSVSYAHWHQSGTFEMPRRPVVDVYSSGQTTRGLSLVASWFKILQTYIVNGAIAASALGAAESQGG